MSRDGIGTARGVRKLENIYKIERSGLLCGLACRMLVHPARPVPAAV